MTKNQLSRELYGCLVLFTLAVFACSGGTASDKLSGPDYPAPVEPFKLVVTNALFMDTVDVGTPTYFAPGAFVQDANFSSVGATITFRITAGGGYLNGNPSTTTVTITTPRYGSAYLGSWTLGPNPGLNTLTITADKVRDTTVTLSAVGITPLPEMQSLTRITAGWDHTCGLTQDGTAYCWGSNSKGQLGNNAPKDSVVNTPSRVAGGLKFTSLSAGNFHTCGVTTTRVAYCWGQNNYGQLGDGTRVDRFTPVAVISAPPFVSIFAGGGRTNFDDIAHTCALTQQGAAYCWGYNGYGQAGTGVPGNIWLQPAAVLGGISFRNLTTGGYHTCGVSVSGDSYCWGSNASGQLGNTGGGSGSPLRVTGGLSFDTLAAGADATCGVAPNGLYCWGSDYSGQLGVGGQQSSRATPTLVVGSLILQSPALGLFHTCARTTAGAAYCWGWSFLGQLGAGPRLPEEVPSPVAVSTSARFVQFALGSAHSCGLTISGTAYCWGSNDYGELGDGTRKQRTTPVAVRLK